MTKINSIPLIWYISGNFYALKSCILIKYIHIFTVAKGQKFEIFLFLVRQLVAISAGALIF